jgi:hypothetical protein
MEVEAAQNLDIRAIPIEGLAFFAKELAKHEDTADRT